MKIRKRFLCSHAAIHAYLCARGEQFADAASSFAVAGGISGAGPPGLYRRHAVGVEPLASQISALASVESCLFAAPSIVPQLERKWSAGIKLQKRIMDLEAQVNELQGELHAARAQARGTTATPGSSLAVEWLPAAPASHSLTAHQGSVAALVPHPVFDAVVSCGEDGLCHVWGLLEGLLQRERTLRGHTAGVACAAFAPSGQRFVTGSADCRIKVWDFSPSAVGAPRGGCIRTLSGHENTVTCLAFLPDAAALVSGSRDGTVRLWDVAGGQCLHTFSAHSGGVRALDVAPDARLLASTGSDGQISIWAMGKGGKVHSGTPLRVLQAGGKGVESLRFAPAAQAQRLARKRAHKLRVQAVGKQLAFDVDGTPGAAAAAAEAGPAATPPVQGVPSETLADGARAEASSGLPAILLSAGRNNTVFVHDADTGEEWMVLVSATRRGGGLGGGSPALHLRRSTYNISIFCRATILHGSKLRNGTRQAPWSRLCQRTATFKSQMCLLQRK